MSDTPLRVLAVEDDPVQARHLRLLLAELGYELAGVAASAEQALPLFDREAPDVVLLDINLDGEADGVDLGLLLNQRRPGVPLIFITARRDAATFERARLAGPYAFLTKPYDQDYLARAIELAVQHAAEYAGQPAPTAQAGLLVPEALFVREGLRLVKVPYGRILYIEADNTYSHLHTPQRKHTVRLSLRELEQRLPEGQFVRIQRGYLVQAACIEGLDLQSNEVLVRGQRLPVGRTYREALLGRLNLVG